MPSELRSRRLAPDDEEGDAELMASYVTVADASGVPTDDSSRARDQKRGLDGDGANVLVLLFLYILQVSLIVDSRLIQGVTSARAPGLG